MQVRGPPPPEFGYDRPRQMLVVGRPCDLRLSFLGKEVEAGYSVRPALPA